MTIFDPEKITFFAKTDARGQNVTFGIKAKDRQRHMYVVGKTGMGKSTLLENMAAQDIQNGEGMAFIDPHGSAAEALLEYVPEHRVKDVVYFAPFDTEHPVSFNVMEDVGPDKRHLVVSGLMSTFKKIWVDAWSSRMEYILTNALLVLIEYPDTTLLSVNRLFSDKAYRKKVVEHCQDPAVKSFWVDEFANYTDRFAAEALPAIQNKVGQFTGNPLIRNIIGQPHSSFDIRKLMDEKKILIMNLSKGLIGDTNANLLGSMLTTRIYLAAMSRADLPVSEMKKMPNFYFYVDEFQSFANATFADILSEARKYHLNLIIAHQYIAQMEEEVRDAVFGNVGTTIAFRVGPFDAEVLETVFAPRFEATDLVNLGFAQIYLTLMIDGIGSQPFSAVTLPPVELPAVSCSNLVIEASRQAYSGGREEVEKIVLELHATQRPEASQKQYDKRPNNNQGKSFSPRPNNNQNSYQKKPFENNRGNQNKPVVQREKNRENTTSQNKPRPNVENSRPRENLNNATRPEKTPDDLRKILSKMTQGTDKEKKDNSVSVSTANESQTPKSSDKKPADKNNLKGALADVLQKAGTHQPKGYSTPKQNSEKNTPIQQSGNLKEPQRKPAPRPQISSTESKVPADQPSKVSRENKSQQLPATAQSRPQGLDQSKSQVRNVIVEHRQRRGIEVGKATPGNPQPTQLSENRDCTRKKFTKRYRGEAYVTTKR